MLNLAADREEVRVVDDQTGCPTSALDLARALLAAVQAMPAWGRTYHLAGSGSCGWAEFALSIFEFSQAKGGATARVIGIPSAEYPTAAARPHYSVLDSSRFDNDFGIRLPDWRKALEEVVDRLTDRFSG
jgi:dTDP-4-dehydrorhamnose reductase